jgi:predicted ATPase/DNA-binding SARP family transcriptional activator
MLEIRLLGRFELRLDGEPIEISSRPSRMLLSYLVLTRMKQHPREKIAGLIWPDSTETNARKNLRQALWRLRKAIGEAYLLNDTQSIAFNPTSDFWLDVAVLEEKEQQHIVDAISAYEGELLPGFYDDWILLERDRLEAIYERKMHQFIEQLIQEQRWEDVLNWGEHWIAKGQIPEAAYRALMRAHAAVGELSKVEMVYRRCIDALLHDIGVEPSAETEQLYRRLLAGEPVSQPADERKAVGVGVAETRHASLPAQATPFIGRLDELIEIQNLLSSTRLLSITGPGGIGKTRLAIKAASEVADQFENGCVFVPLAPIREVDRITQAVAEALNFPLATHEDSLLQLLRYLMKRQVLLVMDNFEHLMDGVDIVNEILSAAPEVKILATSREKLNVKSETNFNLSGMDVPELAETTAIESFDAISLFIQSADKTRPRFAPSPDELVQITKICRNVGGMPLAIELATAWLHVLTVGEIVGELEKGFDLLETDKRDAPERHSSIRGVFNQSWLLLDQAEQALFTKLSVFRGGFTREAAEQVAGASLHHLAGLVNKSFLSYDPNEGRFELHELLRQYAQEHLEERQDVKLTVQEAYAAYFADFMETRGVYLRGNKQKIVIDEIVADFENVRAAWRYYLNQGDAPMLWKFITSMWHIYWIRWRNLAGMELFAEAVIALNDAVDEECLALRGLAMAFQSYFMGWVGIPETGFDLAQESVEILGQFSHIEALVFAYDSLALNAYFLGRMTEERKAIDKMLELSKGLRDKWLQAFTLFAVGMITLIEGDYTEARRLAETNLKIYEELGDVSGSSTPLIILGHAALALGEYDDAREYYQRCLAKAEGVNFYYSIQTASKYLGKLLISTGNLEEAEFYLCRSLRITREIGWVRDIINLIYEIARLRVEQGRVEQAVELLTMVIQHPSSDQIRWLEGSIRESAESLLTKLESEASPDIIKSGTDRGLLLELDQVVSTLLATDRI